MTKNYSKNEFLSRYLSKLFFLLMELLFLEALSGFVRLMMLNLIRRGSESDSFSFETKSQSESRDGHKFVTLKYNHCVCPIVWTSGRKIKLYFSIPPFCYRRGCLDNSSNLKCCIVWSRTYLVEGNTKTPHTML